MEGAQDEDQAEAAVAIVIVLQSAAFQVAGEHARVVVRTRHRRLAHTLQ